MMIITRWHVPEEVYNIEMKDENQLLTNRNISTSKK